MFMYSRQCPEDQALISLLQVLAILKNMPSISEKYLETIVNDKELYDDCDTEVKRQIWKDNQALFGDQVTPLFQQYIRQKEKILFDYENKVNLFFTHSPKVIILNE